jgi:hypothetical protein
MVTRTVPHCSNIQRTIHSSQLGSVVWHDRNGASRRRFKDGRTIGKEIRHGLGSSSYYINLWIVWAGTH